VFGSSPEQDVAFLREVRSSRRGVLPFVALAAALSACAACGPVAAYQRGRLAHPTMQLGDMTNAAEAHVNGVHEGATGGAVGASSGCGCN
jgi:hypothetical protein